MTSLSEKQPALRIDAATEGKGASRAALTPGVNLKSVRPTRPALRYHGGKWKLAPWIVSRFPAHRIYVEAFGGGASVLLRKPRSYAEVYNDLDGEIVSFFRVLQDPAQSLRLEQLLIDTPFARDEFVLAYHPTDDPVERARRLLIRSFMGFGSDGHNDARMTGFRANSNRSGTTPARDWRNFPAQVSRFHDRLRGVVIENRPAIEVMRQHDAPTTLFYVDPPYLASTRRDGKNYRFEMSDYDHQELAGVLRSLSGAVILSGYRSTLYDELFGDWVSEQRKAHADGALERVEVLWFNPKAAWQDLLSPGVNLGRG